MLYNVSCAVLDIRIAFWLSSLYLACPLFWSTCEILATSCFAQIVLMCVYSVRWKKLITPKFIMKFYYSLLSAVVLIRLTKALYSYINVHTIWPCQKSATNLYSLWNRFATSLMKAPRRLVSFFENLLVGPAKWSRKSVCLLIVLDALVL